MRPLVELDADHPGFRDAEYRQRRNAIAAIAVAHDEGEPVPHIAYTDDELGVWRTVCQHLGPLHATAAHPRLDAIRRRIGLFEGALPQMEDVNRHLAGTDFRMEPVAGLVEARTFLEALGRGIFLATQYIRHASRPLYTPEPDVVHELVGHAASLIDPGLAALSRRFGEVASRVDDAAITPLIRVYWWALEFGLVREEASRARVGLEGERVYAAGAGLLSSAAELAGATAGAAEGPERRSWDLDAMAATPFDPTRPNPVLFVAPGFDAMLDDLDAWLLRFGD